MKLATKIAFGIAVIAVPVGAYAVTRHLDDEADENADIPELAISREVALHTAGSLANGELLEAEPELENGAWRWSVEYSENGMIHEIGIDATSGEVIEDSWEEAKQED